MIRSEAAALVELHAAVIELRKSYLAAKKQMQSLPHARIFEDGRLEGLAEVSKLIRAKLAEVEA